MCYSDYVIADFFKCFLPTPNCHKFLCCNKYFITKTYSALRIVYMFKWTKTAEKPMNQWADEPGIWTYTHDHIHFVKLYCLFEMARFDYASISCYMQTRRYVFFCAVSGCAKAKDKMSYLSVRATQAMIYACTIAHLYSVYSIGYRI